MKVHPYADLFPLIEGTDFTLLCDDIKENGLQNPIVLLGDEILDGRNRYLACMEVDVQPEWTQYQGENPLAFVLSSNLHRRHLTASQRAALGAEIATLSQGVHARSKIANISYLSQSEAGAMLQVSPAYIKLAKRIKENTPELFEEMKSGQKTLQQVNREIIGEDEILRMATKIRLEKKEVLKAQKEKLRREALAIKPPEGQYRTIVIDPPWDIDRIQLENRTFDKQNFDYATMTVDEIKDFKLPAHDECHLWLWTTQKYLRSSFEILDAWDFTYLSTFVWHKKGGFQPVGLPQFNCEFVLLARKGAQPFLETKNFFTCFEAERREHSRKPEEFYDVVRRVSPEPRIDIFSRENREGYDTWGLEEGKFGDDKTT